MATTERARAVAESAGHSSGRYLTDKPLGAANPMQSRCRQPQEVGNEFGELLEATSAIRTSAERLDLESPNGWTLEAARSLSAFSDRLVTNLLPSLAATELVFGPYLDAELKDALKADHQQMRQFTERIAMVSEAISRSRHPKSEVTRARIVVRSILEALENLEVHQIAAVSQVVATLPDSLGEIADSLERAASEARKRIVLITQAEMPATEASVLRRRPDLYRAYATNLAALDQSGTGESVKVLSWQRRDESRGS